MFVYVLFFILILVLFSMACICGLYFCYKSEYKNFSIIEWYTNSCEKNNKNKTVVKNVNLRQFFDANK